MRHRALFVGHREGRRLSRTPLSVPCGRDVEQVSIELAVEEMVNQLLGEIGIGIVTKVTGMVQRVEAGRLVL